MSLTVYLSGQYLPYEQASIPVEDRSFLFADGVYEVIRVYGGRPFTMEEHLTRLARSARELNLPAPDLDEIRQVCRKLLQINRLSEATIYIQLSRGAYAPRTHAFPVEAPRPILLVLARPATSPTELRLKGATAITLPEQRWSRCDIKSVSLLPNVMAKQKAAAVGAYEAIFVRDGFAIEGSSTNLFAVLDGEIRTYPACNYILSGITRSLVLKLARELGYPVREEEIPVEALSRCSEIWVTASTTEIMPIIAVDGRQVGDGRPGPVAAALYEAFQKLW